MSGQHIRGKAGVMLGDGYACASHFHLALGWLLLAPRPHVIPGGCYTLLTPL